MTKYACCRAISARPIDPEVHRHIRLRRLGLRDATARLIAELAYGQPRDAVLVFAVSDAGTLAEGVRR